VTRTEDPEAKPSGPVARRKGEKFGARRREILDAATEVFHRRGYSAASIQEIADEVGLLKGSLYYYIDSKEDLLFTVLSETYDLAKAQIDRVEAMEGLGPLERLGAYIEAHVNFIAEHTTKMAIYYSDFELVGEERKLVLIRQRKQFERYITSLITQAQKAGEVSDKVDAKMAAYLILGEMNWAYTWYRPEGRVSPRKLGKLAADLVLNGLRGSAP
jgi:TetR/AcrR family transcriptional regulator, cholesterol catabolism regulator